jgi:hypothetical protein
MKRSISSSLSLVAIIAFSSMLQANTFRVSMHSVQINNRDYQLNIIEAKIPLMKDTVFGGNKCLVTYCPLTLTNSTNDTLRYAGMSASWWDIYTIDNKGFSLAADHWNVFKNGAVVNILPPHQSVTKNIKIITYKDYCRGETIKIAMHLQKVAHIPVAGDIKSIRSDSNYIIWSNEVTIR